MTKSESTKEVQAHSASTGPQTNPSLPTGGLRQVTMTQPALAEESARLDVQMSPGARGPDPYLGATIDGRYFVEAQLGEGGMGVVYRCRHTIIDKKVAMKVLRADMARNEEVTERFLNEARSASSIGNPHIIDISDFGRLPDGATYFIMEFLVGTPLSDLTDKALSPARVGHIGVQLVEGLKAAHDVGIVHRDLKPDNIFLVSRGSEPDFVKILDFGIAKASTSANKLTQAGQVFGTPHYMSPEQAAGSEVDHRSDIYAVGIILYELATGRLPFDADNFMAILTQHMYKAPVPPSQSGSLPHPLPHGLENVILKCLAKDPGDRFQDMGKLGIELRAVFTGMLPVSTRDRLSFTDPYGSPREYYDSRPAIPQRKSKAALLFLAIGATVALIAGALVWLGHDSSSAAPEGTESSVSASQDPPASKESPVAPEEPAPPPVKRVAIAVAPLSAHVYRGEQDLGESPVMVEVGEEPLRLTVQAKGYVTRTLNIDGADDKVSIELEKVPTASSTPRPTSPRPTSPRSAPAAAPQPKPLGGGELVDPWD